MVELVFGQSMTLSGLRVREPQSIPAATARGNFLFAIWEGGGSTPPTLSIVRKLVDRGHRVRVLADICNSIEIEDVGAVFIPWKRTPRRPNKSAEYDPIKDWEAKSPISVLGRVRDRLMVGPSLLFAKDCLDELSRTPADVVVVNDMLLGAMAAAESAQVPCVALSANLNIYPTPGLPPFGPGLQPATGPLGRFRDELLNGFTRLIFARGKRTFNEMRGELGLPALDHPFDQIKRLNKHLLLTSKEFDFPAGVLPPQSEYVGPELHDPAWVESWKSPWQTDDPRPLILVAFSTTFQNQVAVLGRIVEALNSLEVRAIVTLGPSIRSGDFGEKSNVFVCSSAPHSQLLLNASAVISHAGHGTVMRSLAAGVPLLCMPMGRDQNDNAARVVARGAGLRLSMGATINQIRTAIVRLLASDDFRKHARRLGDSIVEESRNSPAIKILEEVASRSVLTS